MKFLLDTDTCVFWLRGRESVRERLAAAGLDSIAISILTLAELRYGADCSARPAENHQTLDNFTSTIAVLGVDLETARLFGEVKAHLRKQGALIEDIDLLIAATARAYDLALVTNNSQHFARIPGLRLENWA